MSSPPRVALFVTCLADFFRPTVAMAAVRLLEQAGCQVEVPLRQTCCGQPGYNSGDFPAAQALARQVIEAFEPFDYVVAPSGSCAAMLKIHYPRLLENDPRWRRRAEEFAPRCHELMSFLHDVRALQAINAECNAVATYHDSCSGLRELGVKDQPRQLLSQVRGLELKEMKETEVCCGFGGTFCVKYPEISTRMASDKVANLEATGANLLLGGDLGCLLNLAGRMRRLGSPARVFHAAEILAGFCDIPAIGEPFQGDLRDLLPAKPCR